MNTASKPDADADAAADSHTDTHTDPRDAALAAALKFLGHDAREGHSSTLALLELQRIKPDPLTLPQLIERVEQNARRALAAIDDFMDLNRARSDPLRLETLDLADLLVEVVADAWTIASQRGVRVLVAPGGPAEIVGRSDRELLNGALAKLLRDAVLAAPRGTVLSCSLREAMRGAGAGVVIEITAPPTQAAAADASGAAPEPAPRAPRVTPGLAFARIVAARLGGSVEVELGPERQRTIRTQLPLASEPDRAAR